MPKLLLADDSITVQRVIALTFQGEGIEVIAVGDGDQAVDAIDRERPQIVLADLSMPGRDGYAVAEYVKRSPELSKDIRVVLLTGAAEPVEEARSRDLGIDGVLSKPFEPHVATALVRRLLGETPTVPGFRAAGSGDAAGSAPPYSFEAAQAGLGRLWRPAATEPRAWGSAVASVAVEVATPTRAARRPAEGPTPWVRSDSRWTTRSVWPQASPPSCSASRLRAPVSPVGRTICRLRRAGPRVSPTRSRGWTA